MSDFERYRDLRLMMAAAGLVVIAIALATALMSVGDVNVAVRRGVSTGYNYLVRTLAPNNTANWVYDYRGFDTCLESMIIYLGAFASVLTLGRGIIKMRGYREREGYEKEALLPREAEDTKPTLILRYFGLPAAMLTTAYGIYVVTGGHMSGGGGFQSGVIISTAFLLACLVYGRKENPFRFRRAFLVKLASVGMAGYALLAVPGLILTGYALYNVGANIWGGPYIQGLGVTYSFPAGPANPYPPDPGVSMSLYPLVQAVVGGPWILHLWLSEVPSDLYITPGTVPYINLAEGFNVTGAISLIILVFLLGWREEEEE